MRDVRQVWQGRVYPCSRVCAFESEVSVVSEKPSWKCKHTRLLKEVRVKTGLLDKRRGSQCRVAAVGLGRGRVHVHMVLWGHGGPPKEGSGSVGREDLL